MYHFSAYCYDGSVVHYCTTTKNDFNYQEFFEDNPEVKDVMVQYTDSDNKIVEEVYYR